MDDLLARHRKEQRDLQSKITQKKKSASKKTRKGVNDECAALEQELKTKQQHDLDVFDATADESAETSVTAETLAPEIALLTAIAETPPEVATLEEKTQELAITEAWQIDAADAQSTQQSEHRKPNRQKARLARRAAEQEAVIALAKEEAARMPDFKQRERTKMLEEFDKRGLKEKEVAANGHCMFSAVADQMRLLGLDLVPGEDNGVVEDEDGTGVKAGDYKIVRKAAAKYMVENEGDFVPFLEEPLEAYVKKIEETGEWGGQLELLALAKTYNININVLQEEGRVEKIEGGTRGETWLAYYRHGFGLGEHYNSLRTDGTEAGIDKSKLRETWSDKSKT